MFERFTEGARQVIVLAQQEARSLKHASIGTGHLLLGILSEGEGVGAKTLEYLGVNAAECRNVVSERTLEADPAPTGQIPFTPHCHKALELSLREALSLGHNYIGTEHILLGLIRQPEGMGATILAGLGIDAQKVRDETLHTLNRGPVNTRRWAEYLICQKRGHEARERGVVARQIAGKDQCAHCGTFFWTETIMRESGAPAEPKTEVVA